MVLRAKGALEPPVNSTKQHFAELTIGPSFLLIKRGWPRIRIVNADAMTVAAFILNRIRVKKMVALLFDSIVIKSGFTAPRGLGFECY